MAEVSEAGKRIMGALAAVRAHAESHKCDACVLNASMLFDALGYWIAGEEGQENNNRAKLEEVFGGKESKEGAEQAEGKLEGQGDWEKEWQ